MNRLYAGTLLAAGIAFSAQAQDPFTVFFDLGSAAITQDGMDIIDAAAEEYRETGSASVSIIGHTDTTGSREFNLQLSQRRAEAVAAELQSRGVPPDEVILGWRGQDDLAVQTADNVAEPRNRRAEIAVAEASTMPMASPAPAAASSRFRVGIGPYIGFNNEGFDESVYLGANLTADYFVTPNISVGGEQAIFYNTFGADDDGIGSRSALSADYHFAEYGMGGLAPHVGVNAGFLTVDGSSTGGWFAGPEIGVSYGSFTARAAYDFVEPRDADDGVLSLTVGYNFRF
jgi:hypothetical protein